MKFFNIIDYVKWRGDITLKEREFNAIDALVLNMVAFLNVDKVSPLFPSKKKITLEELINNYFSKENIDLNSLGLIIPNEIFELSVEVLKSNRYKNIKVSNYINKIEKAEIKQFSALLFHLDKENIYVSYRGTDDSLVGWVEDFNMLAYYPIPSQKEASQYLSKISQMFKKENIYIGGHSKGGNLAIYALLDAEENVKNRVIKTYSFDGPGFIKEYVDQEKFLSIQDKIEKIVPNSSIIGRIFSLNVYHKIVESNAKGLDQHSPFTWNLIQDQFVTCKGFTKYSSNIKVEVEKLIKSISEEERKELVDDLGKYIDALKQSHLIEFLNYRNVFSLITNKYRMKRKNIRYVLKLYLILSRNKALSFKSIK